MAKEEEKAQRAAEKAAEEAALKAKQTAIEDEQRKRREEERARREAERKAREEEKQRKDEERRKRLAEEKEREAEREKKRKEKEEKAKAERREREEKERRAREEREAKAAQEKAAAAAKREQMEKEKKEKDEKERKEKEEKAEKAEKEAKERLAQHQQQRSVSSSSKLPRAPPSPRDATGSGSSSNQRTPSINGANGKKIMSKPPPVSAPTAGPSQAQPLHPQRSQQHSRQPVQSSLPPTPITPLISQHLPSQPPMFNLGPPGIIPPGSAISPRIPFVPPPYGFPAGPSMQPSPTSPLAPSAIPRNYGMGGPAPPFDPPFPRVAPIVTPAPIAPPPKTPLPPSSLAPGANRRASVPDPGPITRPIAPIARPSEPSGSGSGSPVRRSPSPKGVLGSSALAADDDEVVSAPSRRTGSVGTVGQGWGPASPRGAIGENSVRPPWGAPGPPGPLAPGPSGFGSPRPIGGLWGSPANPEWHPSNGQFYSNSFLTNATSPQPHSNS